MPSSWIREQTLVFCIGRWCHQGSPSLYLLCVQMTEGHHKGNPDSQRWEGFKVTRKGPGTTKGWRTGAVFAINLLLSCFSHIWLLVTLWTVAHQAPLSMGFSRQEYWSGLPFPPPGDLPHPGIEPESLTSPASAGGFFTTSTIWEAQILNNTNYII